MTLLASPVSSVLLTLSYIMHVYCSIAIILPYLPSPPPPPPPPVCILLAVSLVPGAHKGNSLYGLLLVLITVLLTLLIIVLVVLLVHNRRHSKYQLMKEHMTPLDKLAE